MVSVTLLEFAVCSSDVNKLADDSSGCAAVPATPTRDATTEPVAFAAPVENTHNKTRAKIHQMDIVSQTAAFVFISLHVFLHNNILNINMYLGI